MNWLERYTFAVKAHLPASIRDDVATELLTDLQDECDHRAEILGHDLSDDDVKNLLRERGHPLTVAAGFQPRKTLVSESLFPLYSIILKWLVIAIALIQSMAVLLDVISQTDPSYVQSMLRLISSIFSSSLYAFAWLTLVFYIIGESLTRADIFTRWRPEHLPKATLHSQQISQTGSTAELILQLFFLVWLNQLIPTIPDEASFALVFTDQWSTLLPWINAILVAGIAFNAFKLISPYWTHRKAIIDGLLYILALIILGVIASWDSPLAIQWGSGDQLQRFAIPTAWIDIAVFGYLVVVIIEIVVHIRRFCPGAPGEPSSV